MYMLSAKTIGSVKLSVNGRTRIIITISFFEIFSASISSLVLSLLLPVCLRRRTARRKRMFDALVSGRKTVKKQRQKPESHKSSHIVHCQPLFSAAKPPTCDQLSIPRLLLYQRKGSSYQRTKRRATDSRNTPDSHRVDLVLGHVHIRYRRSAGRENGRSEDASQKSKSEKHAYILCIDDAELEEHEHH